jgi:hypothetical protein
VVHDHHDRANELMQLLHDRMPVIIVDHHEFALPKSGRDRPADVTALRVIRLYSLQSYLLDDLPTQNG